MSADSQQGGLTKFSADCQQGGRKLPNLASADMWMTLKGYVYYVYYGDTKIMGPAFLIFRLRDVTPPLYPCIVQPPILINTF